MTPGEDFPHRRRVVVRALLRPMREALEEARPQINALIERIPTIPQQSLVEHGLQGRQLDVKFTVVKRHFRRFEKSGGARLLRNFLTVLDTILDSIIEVAGVGGALKELEEAIAYSTLVE